MEDEPLHSLLMGRTNKEMSTVEGIGFTGSATLSAFQRGSFALLVGVNSTRLLSVLAFVGYFLFWWVDPFLVDETLPEIRTIRVALLGLFATILGLTWTAWGNRNFIGLGVVVSLLCGGGVTVLTDLTGGVSSPYWTMIMLTFFGTSLILPLQARGAAALYLTMTVFYVVWMREADPDGRVEHWVTSLAGLVLSGVVSVAGTTFLTVTRNREGEARDVILQMNERLIEEIEERERAEALVQRTQQLDAVGRLGAGLAHEINNLLAAISGSAESIQRDESSGIHVERILRASQMGADLTRNLLVFSRKTPRNNAPVDLSAVVRDVGGLVERMFPRRVKLSLEGLETEWWIEGDEAVLTQSILNLCLNGVHAMEGQGELQLRIHPIQGEGRIGLDVRDHGCGMSEEVQEKAVEPFFTTRDPGEGTGLGLSMAYGAIQNHQGSLDIESIEGQGTVIRLKFPCLDRGAESQTTPRPREGARRRSTTSPFLLPSNIHVLLVEDDEQVRDVMRDLLRTQRCEVAFAESGDKAVAMLQEDCERFDAVVLDRVMPGISGDEALVKLRDLNPGLPIVMYSGLPIGAETQALIEHPRTAFLQKPFTHQELFTTIQTVLPAARG